MSLLLWKQHIILAPVTGTLVDIQCQVDNIVQDGGILAIVENAADDSDEESSQQAV
jgi:hypothetical protein